MYIMDVMLEKVTRWLRMFGQDVRYPKSVSDDEIIDYTVRMKGTLVTSDKEMYKKAKLKNVKAILIKSQQFDMQLIEFLKITGIMLPSKPVEKYCPLCNGRLIKLTGKAVLHMKKHIPPKVFKTNRYFWRCSLCKKLYWRGTHYDQMIKSMRKLKQMIK